MPPPSLGAGHAPSTPPSPGRPPAPGGQGLLLPALCGRATSAPPTGGFGPQPRPAPCSGARPLCLHTCALTRPTSEAVRRLLNHVRCGPGGSALPLTHGSGLTVPQRQPGAQAAGPLLPAASPEQGQASGRHRPSPIRSAGASGGPGQTSTDKRRTLVASGWQALPLDYGRGITLPFPALPLRVAPEHPGKPGSQLCPRPRAEGQTWGQARAQGAWATRGTGPGRGSCPPRPGPAPGGPLPPRCSGDTAVLTVEAPSLACPSLWGGGGAPRDNRLPRLRPHRVLTRCWRHGRRGSVREKTQ